MQPVDFNKCIAAADISHYNQNIDWVSVKASNQIGALSIKATEGATYIDPALAANVAGARSIGVPIQLYHLARPNQTSAQDEANNFIKQLKFFSPELLPCLDLEEPYNPVMDKAALIQWVKDFINLVSQAIGQEVIIYTGKWFADYYNDFDGQFAQYPLWVCSYVDSYDQVPVDFGSWNHWVGWQHSDKGNVEGIPGYVDLDIIYDLDAIKIKTPPVEPPKPVYLLSVDDANKGIALVSGVYNLPWTSNEDKNSLHQLANAFRVASGQPIQEG